MRFAIVVAIAQYSQKAIPGKAVRDKRPSSLKVAVSSFHFSYTIAKCQTSELVARNAAKKGKVVPRSTSLVTFQAVNQTAGTLGEAERSMVSPDPSHLTLPQGSENVGPSSRCVSVSSRGCLNSFSRVDKSSVCRGRLACGGVEG